MNRIYQGRAVAVVARKPVNNKKDPVEWVPLGFTAEEYAKAKEERAGLLQVAGRDDEAAVEARKKLAALNRCERGKWETALREQHMTFQDGVNYYFVALAAMAEGLKPKEEGERPREVERLRAELEERKSTRKRKKAKATGEEERRDKEIEEQITRLRREEAVWQWRNQVRDNWESVKRGGESFEGPKARLSKLLGLSPGKDSFEDACKAVLKVLDAERLKAALMRLLELAGASTGDNKLPTLVESKLPFLCAKKTKAGDDVTANEQMKKRQAEANKILAGDEGKMTELAQSFDLSCFSRQPPTTSYTGSDAVKRALDSLKAGTKSKRGQSPPFPSLVEAKTEIEAELRRLRKNPPSNWNLPSPAKPPTEFHAALLFRALPSQATWQAVRKAAEMVLKRKVVERLVSDPLLAVRAGGTPPFDYFSNRAFARTGNTDAAWFAWDKAAFVEALKSPHRYFQDTLKRDAEREALEKRRDKMKGEGEESSGGDDSSEDTYGFKGDHRIEAIEKLVRERDLLGYLEEDDDEEDPQYPIHENTLRGWSKLRQAWREAEKNTDPAKLTEELDRIRLEQQGERPEEAGGGALFKVLQRSDYHCIWRDTPKGNQADDPLWAWVNFRELEEKIASLKLPIRFTPAHATKSPRFFIFPKTSNTSGKAPKNPEKAGQKTAHIPGMFVRNDSGEIVPVKGDESWLGSRPRLMALNAGVLVQTKDGLQPTGVRVYYVAPRLRRDAIRRDGESGLGAAAMIQPMMEALGIAPAVPTVNFANCAVTLRAEPEDRFNEAGEWSINLTFPVSVEPEELQNHPLFRHQTRWSYRPSGKGGEKNFAQFKYSAEEPRYELALRWPIDEQHDVEAKEANPGRALRKPLDRKWWEDNDDRFTCLSVDLGQRVGGAFAVLDARAGVDFGMNKKGKAIPSRFIGETPGKRWHAAVAAKGLLSLSGEDANVFRPRTTANESRPSPDDRNKKDTKPGKDFREELWGDKGRPPLRQGDPGALHDETEEARRLLTEFDQLDIMPPGWDQRSNRPSTELSFPEQNDYLLKAVSRYMSRIRRLHRWCAFLKPNDKDKRTPERQQRALKEIREACGLDEAGKPKVVESTGQSVAGESWIADKVSALVADGKHDAELQSRLAEILRPMLHALPGQMETVANRCVPLRGRSWKWEQFDQDEQGKPLHILRQSGDAIPTVRMNMPDGKEREVTWIRGQRGFSSQRIEQIEFLRKILQSLNSIQRREIGELIKRQKRTPDGGIPRLPDCCPDLLDKLAELKEQRVNQLAHQILAEALGVRLRREGPIKGYDERTSSDIHGEYERIPCRLDPSGFRRPVDFIVIEDLKYYDTAVMRSRRENTRLMRWCRRHFRDKLKQLCEVFGIPVVETNPADTSKFCSRSGVAGFRGVEVGPGFEHDFVWAKALKKLERHEKEGAKLDANEKARCLAVRELVKQVAEAQAIPTKDGTLPRKPRTLLAPMGGGNVFVPVVGTLSDTTLPPAVAQADINAAINLGLRAIAEPTLWEIHPRLRTLRKKPEKPGEAAPKELSTREKRKYGEKAEPLKLNLTVASAIHDTRQPLYYRDLSGKANGDTAEVADPANPGNAIQLVSGKALWGEVKAAQWRQVKEINNARLAAWRNKFDPMPD